MTMNEPKRNDDLEEGYRRRTDRDRWITALFDTVARKADEELGGVPNW